MSQIPYRPDIDGLRAIAVLSVVFFHAGLAPFGGGFVGVDIFFVITGFLMTSIILRQREAGTFGIGVFFVRRARRILPAMLIVTIATLGAAWFVYSYLDIRNVGAQALSALGIISNIFFYFDTDYFNAADETVKPFIHFWTLSLEEQFYLLFPFVMAAVMAQRRVKGVYIIAGIAAASFALCLWMVERDQMAAFYRLPFRAWEFLIGAMAAFSAGLPARAGRAASAAGLLMISAAIFGFSKDMVHPGIGAAVVCAGSVFIILSGGQGTAAWILSRRPLVLIGLLSYSLYLWHWPVLAMAGYLNPAGLGGGALAICFAVIFALSFASWKFIETPFRRKDAMATKSLLIFVGVLYAAAISLAAFIFTQSHSRKDFFNAAMAVESAKEEPEFAALCDLKTLAEFRKTDICQTNPDSGVAPSFIVWGDSYARAAAGAFFRLSREHDRNGYALYAADCPPINGAMRRGNPNNETCRAFTARVLKFIAQENIRHVFIVANWTYWLSMKDHMYFEGVEDKSALTAARETVLMIAEIGALPYIVVNHAAAPYNIPRLHTMEQKMGVRGTRTEIPLADYMQERRENADALLDMLMLENVVIIDPMDLFCKEGRCVTVHEGQPLYSDHGHLSRAGADFIAPIFAPYFERGFD